jgi:hypothetical protein
MTGRDNRGPMASTLPMRQLFSAAVEPDAGGVIPGAREVRSMVRNRAPENP